MDPQTIAAFGQFGLAGMIAMVWYLDRKDIQRMMDTYEVHMAEIREMYKNNVRLVEGYDRICNDLHSVVVVNTQAMQRLTDAVNANQFCPMVRVVKKKEGTDTNG